jgi:replication-associated recombination protein RarA
LNPFVGRRAEMRRVWAALSRGRHVVLSGPHGIGRTTLMRQVAQGFGSEMPFVFTDLSATSGEASRALYEILGGEGRPVEISSRTIRYRLMSDLGRRNDPCVLVLDNITRLTRSRLDFVSGLASAGRFRIAAIVGTRMGKAPLDALRRSLGGAEVIPLGWLRPPDVREFLRQASAAHGFEWREDEIDARARSIGGYPLAMVAAVERERQLRRPDADPPAA